MAARRRRLSLKGMFRRWLDRALDNTFSVQIVALLFLTILIAGAGTLLAMYMLDIGDPGAASWWSWIRVVDPSVLQGDGEESRVTIALSATIVIAGWIVFGLLISIITTAFQERLERIKSGTTELHVSDHTIVLGWNSTVFAVIDQLASEDEQAASDVVVMCARDVGHMRAEAKTYCLPKSLLRTQFRQGEISSVGAIRDLKIQYARQVIVLGPEDEQAGSDGEAEGSASSNVLKAVLACSQALPEGPRKSDAYRMPIVAMVDTMKAARAIQHGVPMSVRERFLIRAIHSGDFLARLTAQIANEPEMARVFNELLCYEGAIVEGIDTSSEIYVSPIDKRMVGLTFDQCLMGYEKAIPFGYVAGERTVINPRPGSSEAARPFAMGDHIVALANRLNDVVWHPGREELTSSFVPESHRLEPKRILVMGEGRKVRRILEQLPLYLPEGSTITTNQPTDDLDAGKCRYERAVRETGEVTAAQGAPGAAGSPGAYTMMTSTSGGGYDRIVLVDDSKDATRHDSRVLMTLANIQAATPLQKISSSVIVELLDYRNVELVRAYGEMAAVVSSQLASNFLVQLGVEPRRAAVFEELLSPEGCEIHMRPAEFLFRSPEELMTFDGLLARSRRAGCVLIGYLPAGDKPEQLLPTDRTSAFPAAHYAKLVVISED